MSLDIVALQSRLTGITNENALQTWYHGVRRFDPRYVTCLWRKIDGLTADPDAAKRKIQMLEAGMKSGKAKTARYESQNNGLFTMSVHNGELCGKSCPPCGKSSTSGRRLSLIHI